MAKFNTGQSFADGDQVTGAKLNNIVGLLDIYSGVIADQTAIAATVSTADLLLIADTDAGSSGAANKVTIQKLLNDTLTGGTFTNANISEQLTYGTATGNRTISTSAVITNGTISNATLGTTTGTLATITNLTAGTTTSTAANITNGTVQTLTASTGTITIGTVSTLNSTTGTIGAFNSTNGTIGNLSTTLAGDFTISQGTGTLATSGATAGTYGSVTAIPFITVDSKGRITSATTGTFSSTPADGSITPAKLSQPLTRGTAVASTSGTAIDFTGIPSWAKRITVMFSQVSTNGVSPLLVQIGTSGGIQNTGYSGLSGLMATAGANLYTGVVAGIPIGFSTMSTATEYSGSLQITNLSANIWTFNGSVAALSILYLLTSAGVKDLAATLDRVRITTVGGSDSFDAGSINIIYEG